MSLSTNVNNLATSVATELKKTRVLLNANALDLSALTTTAKTDLVSAVNEVAGQVASATGIDDTTTSTDSTWSSSKIDSEITTEVATKPSIDDVTPSTTSVYSSSKTDSEIDAAVAGLPEINDTTASTTSVYSSSKTDSQIAGLIDDTTASAISVYSSNKTDTQIDAAISALVNGAPTALDTLLELATAIQGDETQIGSILTALDNRVRFDAAQVLTGAQIAQAQSNINAADATALANLVTAVGDTTTNYVATFTAGLV